MSDNRVGEASGKVWNVIRFEDQEYSEKKQPWKAQLVKGEYSEETLEVVGEEGWRQEAGQTSENAVSKRSTVPFPIDNQDYG